MPVTVAVEGPTDVAVVRRVLELAGCTINVVHGQSGKHTINRNVAGYNNAARYAPWLVLRDLDHDADCAPDLATTVLPDPAPWMRFRVAVRAIEAWLLADTEAVADFLRVSRTAVPGDPESLDDPKGTLVNLARRSRRAALRDDLVPAPGTSGRVGPAYASRVSEFAANHWRPDVASERSDSLRRCVERARELAGYVQAL